MAEPPEWSHPALLEAGRGTVAPDWIDYNGHMNVVHYRAAFDLASDVLFAELGFAPDHYNARTGATLMVLEEHTRYHAEATVGDEYRVLGRVLGHSTQKLPTASTWRTSPDRASPPPMRRSRCTWNLPGGGRARCRRRAWPGSRRSKRRRQPCPARPTSAG